MARNIIYADNEAYQFGYKDGHKDGFYEGQQMSGEEAYKHAVENACNWLMEHTMVDVELFRKAMNYE